MKEHGILEYAVSLARMFLKKKLNGSITLNFWEGTIKYKVDLHNDSVKKVFDKMT